MKAEAQTNLAIGVAGAAGALLRHMVAAGLASRWASDFPLGTLLVNVSGSFLLGFIVGMGLERGRLPKTWRVPVTVGFIGSYTTFSTWSVDTVLLMEAGRWWLAVLNVTLSLTLGFAATWAGRRLADGLWSSDDT